MNHGLKNSQECFCFDEYGKIEVGLSRCYRNKLLDEFFPVQVIDSWDLPFGYSIDGFFPNVKCIICQRKRHALCNTLT